MKQAWRWFGDGDAISLREIRQAGVTDVVTALYERRPGEVWPVAEIRARQRKVAADLGISQALLSHYENGAREPGLGFVCRACDYYNVTADYLLGRAPNPDGSGSAAEVAKVFINELRVLANKAEAALEELG